MYTATLSRGHLTINLKDNIMADLGSFRYLRLAADFGLASKNVSLA